MTTRQFQHWTAAEIAMLRDLRIDKGLGFAEIALRMDRKVRGVVNKATSVGLPRKKRVRRAVDVPVVREPEPVVCMDDEEPVFAPLEEVAAFAQRYRIPFRGWDDLRTVNEVRDRLLLPRFAKSLACHARRAA
jgi:hypothetical protein